MRNEPPGIQIKQMEKGNDLIPGIFQKRKSVRSKTKTKTKTSPGSRFITEIASIPLSDTKVDKKLVIEIITINSHGFVGNFTGSLRAKRLRIGYNLIRLYVFIFF